VLSPVLVAGVGGLRLREYVRLLALPVSFLLLSGFALLFDITPQQTGVFSFRLFETWFSVNEAAQIRTTLVITRALGAVSCLYMLSLTTPMAEIIGVLRRARCPEVISDLMYLIYRYIFILLSMHYIMRDAAKSRLGFVNYRTSLRTTAMLYSELMSCSYRQAGRNFDAMESRCYGSGIRFFERKEKVTVLQAVCASVILTATVGLTFLLR
jgi:cobalt/nickel transport system permease protein